MKELSNIQNQFGEFLFNFIKSKVELTDDANDIYQDVLVKIATKSHQLKNAQSLKSWVFMIANNQIIDYYRTKKKVVDLSEAPLPVADELNDDNNTYEELESCLQGFINQLPEDDKHIILKSEIDGVSQKELAKELDINYVTLRSKVQRGRTKIKDMISQACAVEKDKNGRPINCEPKGATNSTCGSANASCSN